MSDIKELERLVKDLKSELLTTFKEFNQTNPQKQKIIFAVCIDAMIEFYRSEADCKHARCFKHVFDNVRSYLDTSILITILELTLEGDK